MIQSKINRQSRKQSRKLFRKQSKYTKRMVNYARKQKDNHYYFINRCTYDKLEVLDDTILEKYLKRLGCYPDKMMYVTEQNDKNLVKKHKISYGDFCTYKKKITVPAIKGKINADIFFYSINSKFLDKRLYSYPKFLLNMLNIDFSKITNKDVIYDNIASVDARIPPKYLIPTFPIKDYKKYKFPEYYILRPNESLSGVGVKYISSSDELDDAIKYYEKTKNYKGFLYVDNVIASPYVTNLLLFKGKKFHLRMYYIVSCINGVINSFLLDDGKILTAKEPFDLKIPFTKEKHDTHVKSTGEDLTIKAHFTKDNIGIEMSPAILEDIFQKCKIICGSITKIIIKKVISKDYDKYSKEDADKILFEGQKNGYNIFGVDMFITKDLEPILIECNESSGFGTFTKEYNAKLSNNIFGWINAIILEPLLKYNNPIIAQKHKTYIHLK